VETHDLVKTYDGRAVLDGISLTVAQGEIFALLGPNGAGKTTTISILTTLAQPDGGTALVAGHDVVRHRDEVTRRIALTGQSAAVDDVLTGRENIVMLARLRGLGRAQARSRADELLRRFDLIDAADRRVGSYSGGMRRRLDLALSFVTTPQVLFLDEPTTGLDTRSRRELWDVIRSLTGAGVTVLLTTQYLEEADQLADRIAVLDGGRIVAEGTPAALKARVGGATVQLHDSHGAVLAESATDGTTHGVRAALARWETEGLGGEVTIRRPSLDDVFLDLTARVRVGTDRKEIA
jgi:ABC-2 type transport system ATP-binding protein